MLPIKKIYIDTRFKSSDSVSHSDFNIDLPTTCLMPEDTGFYIDDVCIPHSFYTIETNVNDQLQYVYHNSTRTVTIPEGYYNITTLATAIADGMNTAIGFALVEPEVNLKTNTLKISLTLAFSTGQFNILTDDEITSLSTKKRSMNAVLKNFTSKGVNSSPLFVSGWIDLNPLRNLYLSCSGLGNFNTMTLSGNRSITKQIPVNAGPGEMIFDQTVTGMDYLDCSGQTLSRISFQLKDAQGKLINLHGSHFSFSIVFSRVQNGTRTFVWNLVIYNGKKTNNYSRTS